MYQRLNGIYNNSLAWAVCMSSWLSSSLESSSQVIIKPKRLIAMKLFMKERLLILTILDISHKIAEFIE